MGIESRDTGCLRIGVSRWQNSRAEASGIEVAVRGDFRQESAIRRLRASGLSQLDFLVKSAIGMLDPS